MDQTDGLNQSVGVAVDGFFSLQPKDLDDAVFTIDFANLLHKELNIDNKYQKDPGIDRKDPSKDGDLGLLAVILYHSSHLVQVTSRKSSCGLTTPKPPDHSGLDLRGASLSNNLRHEGICTWFWCKGFGDFFLLEKSTRESRWLDYRHELMYNTTYSTMSRCRVSG
jgi:hypothetical protein